MHRIKDCCIFAQEIKTYKMTQEVNKLNKLQNKFILVSNGEIKVNEPYMNNGVIFYADSEFDEGNNPNNSNPRVTDHNFKIISENPDFSLLSEEDCKEVGWVDVEKLALNDNAFYAYGGDYDTFEVGYKAGFKSAQSLNDKMFSLEDMKRCYEGVLQNVGTCIKQSDLPTSNEYIQSLQQTVWDVEVEMEQVFSHFSQDLMKVSVYKNGDKPKITNGSIKVIKI